MKWTTVSRPDASLKEYHLSETGNTIAILKYNPQQQSARITAGEKQQVFFIERSGFRNNKMVFENEYGVRTGSFQEDSLQRQSGDIILNNTLYHFNLLTAPTAELSIYKEGMVSPLATCALSFQGAQQVASLEHACLLLGLCWHLSSSQPVFNTRHTIPAKKEARPVPDFVIN
jgi:hypothetical protein